MERLVGSLRRSGSRVAVIKHAHRGFDMDRPGKDSWRHRQAGAFEVLVASESRLAKLREYETAHEPTVDQLLGELSPCDWVLIEGFRGAALPKVETWRAETGKDVQFPFDPQIIAIAADQQNLLGRAFKRWRKRASRYSRRQSPIPRQAVNVLLSHELEAFVRAKVESGEYGSSTAVIEEALMLLDDRDHVMIARRERLLRVLADGVAQANNHQLIDAADVYRGLAAKSDPHAE